MHFEKLDLNLLAALDVLLEECNITRAASRLNITQSAMSGILKRLRTYFDDELLVQVGRTMQPTPYALELQEPVREVIHKIRTTITTQRVFDPATSKRHFRITSADFAITVLLRDVLRSLQHEAPHLTFEFFNPYDLPDQLLGQGEAGFLIIPERYTVAEHPSELLFEEEYVCVVCQDNRLIDDKITLEQYKEMGHVTVGLGKNRSLSIEDWFLKKHNIERRVEVVSNSFNALPPLIVGTDRIATMHKRLAQYFEQYLPIKILATPIELPKMREHLQWHQTVDNDPVHRWVRKKIQQHASQLK
jgi:DNA-binding transcriptional LysR family regulator